MYLYDYIFGNAWIFELVEEYTDPRIYVNIRNSIHFDLSHTHKMYEYFIFQMTTFLHFQCNSFLKCYEDLIDKRN